MFPVIAWKKKKMFDAFNPKQCIDYNRNWNYILITSPTRPFQNFSNMDCIISAKNFPEPLHTSDSIHSTSDTRFCQSHLWHQYQYVIEKYTLLLFLTMDKQAGC